MFQVRSHEKGAFGGRPSNCRFVISGSGVWGKNDARIQGFRGHDTNLQWTTCQVRYAVNCTQYAYDALGRLWKVADATGGSIRVADCAGLVHLVAPFLDVVLAREELVLRGLELL
jgi:hypothetical protein